MTPARYVLPSDVARCRPSQPCVLKTACLRWLAPMPDTYALLADFSVTAGGIVCAEHLPILPETPAERPAAKPFPGDE